jgi:hypothetical protein
VRIYLAEGLHRTLVSLRPPAVRGRCDRLSHGSITVFRPRPANGWGPPGFAIPRIAGWGVLGRSRADYRMLNADPERDAMRRAATATILALDCWPALRAYVALSDPSPALAAALWDLAGVLLERERARRSLTDLSDAGRAIPAGDPMRIEVAERAGRAHDRISFLDGDVSVRLHHLTRLADETESFVRRQRALAAAREALHSADYLLETGDPARFPPDPATDLAEHTSAVLTAYQELTS